MGPVFNELKRRNLFKVAIAYLVVAWLVMQVADVLIDNIGAPDWLFPSILLVLGIGFPVALVLAWAFELTPDGIQKTAKVDKTDSLTASTGKKLNGLIITVLSLAIVFLVIERVFFAEVSETDESAAVSESTDKSIAVLPFDDFNAGGEQEYFADGLTEEILNSLARTPDLLVASRTSSFQFKDQNLDITEIADTLGVAHVLEGSVRESKDKYRITAQLIRASDGFHLWSKTYDRPKSDIIDIQEEIAFEIASALETAMDPAALAEMVKIGTNSVEAFNIYLEGLAYSGADMIRERIERFDRARELDPTFAEAHAKAAFFWMVELNPALGWREYMDVPYEQGLENFHERIEQAIQHGNKVDRLFYEGLQAQVNLEYRKAIDLYSRFLDQRPNDNTVNQRIISTAVSIGEYDLASEYLNHWKEHVLDNPFQHSILVAAHFTTKNTQAGVSFVEKTLEKYPYSGNIAYQAHRMLLWAGEYEKARQVFNKITEKTVNQVSLINARIRQACADGSDELAMKYHEGWKASIEGENKWKFWAEFIPLMILGRDEEATAALSPLENDDDLFQLSSFLTYRYFDYTKYPRLVEALEREGHKKGPPEEIPFRCGR